MPIKLDLKDKKILTLLDENARLSNSQIAKKVSLSKPAIEYRIKRLEQNNVIFSYYTVIDFTRLGYSQYKLYFKFQDATLEDEEKVIGYWVNDKNTVWVVQIRGRWDLAVSVLAESNFEFGGILSKFMDKFSKFILEKDVLLTEYSPIYSREYLAEAKHAEFVYGIPQEHYSLDNIDAKILKAISLNSRIQIIGLAKKTGLTRDIVGYRLKKLIKEKVIAQFRAYPNLEVLGVYYCKAIFRTKNLNEAAEKQLRGYVKQHKKATQFLKLIGSWDIEIEFETESEEELYSTLTDIRKKFSAIIRDFDVIRITKTYKYDYYPF